MIAAFKERACYRVTGSRASGGVDTLETTRRWKKREERKKKERMDLLRNNPSNDYAKLNETQK